MEFSNGFFLKRKMLVLYVKAHWIPISAGTRDIHIMHEIKQLRRSKPTFAFHHFCVNLTTILHAHAQLCIFDVASGILSAFLLKVTPLSLMRINCFFIRIVLIILLHTHTHRGIYLVSRESGNVQQVWKDIHLFFSVWYAADHNIFMAMLYV